MTFSTNWLVGLFLLPFHFRVLKDQVGYEVGKMIRIQAERLDCELIELNLQPKHVHLLIKVPPKISISKLMGVIKTTFLERGYLI